MQTEHDVAPSSENDPAGQVVHADRPVISVYFPPAQFEQVAALLVALIFPIKQLGHTEDPDSEYVPAAHS
jgi:hypothetical protein